MKYKTLVGLTIMIIAYSCTTKVNNEIGITKIKTPDISNYTLTKFNSLSTNFAETKRIKTENSIHIDTNTQKKFVLNYINTKKQFYQFFSYGSTNMDIIISNDSISFSKSDKINPLFQKINKQINKISFKGLDIISINNKLNSIAISLVSELKKHNLNSKEYNLLKSIIDGKIAELRIYLAGKYNIRNYIDKLYDSIDNLDINNSQFLRYYKNVNIVFEYIQVKYFRKYNKKFTISAKNLKFIKDNIKNIDVANDFITIIASNIIPDISNKEKQDLLEKVKSYGLDKPSFNY